MKKKYMALLLGALTFTALAQDERTLIESSSLRPPAKDHARRILDLIGSGAYGIADGDIEVEIELALRALPNIPDHTPFKGYLEDLRAYGYTRFPLLDTLKTYPAFPAASGKT